MAGFDWNTFYSLFKAKMSGICTVGRYTIPREGGADKNLDFHRAPKGMG